MEYKLLTTEAPQLLEKEVNHYLGSGWRPLGGPVITALIFGESGRTRVIYAQAVTLEAAPS